LVLGIDRDAQQENFVSNPIPVLLSKLDLVAIVSIIMSLVAILLSHSAITGEREAGLLKLMLSTSISRTTIVLGKFIGGVLTLIIPFTLGVLVGLAYIALGASVELSGLDTGVFAILLLLSYIYVTAFYALGLFVSTRSRTSNVAVLKSLFAWVVLVLVLPNISPFLAAQIYRIPSAAKIQQQRTKIESDDRDEIIRNRQSQMLQSTFSDVGMVIRSTPKQSDLEAKIAADVAFRERYAQYQKAWGEMARDVNIEQRKIGAAIQESFDNQSHHQEVFATVLASLSPLSNFVFAATDVADVGLESDKEWNSQAGRYSGSLREYADRRYEEEKQKNPAFGYNDYLDLRARSRFQFQPPPVSTRLERILIPFGVLMIFNLLFFAGAFVSFLRYDVR
jgi:ABC-type transport system involved in multi-copper enzyme maturation permease subunit